MYTHTHIYKYYTDMYYTHYILYISMYNIFWVCIIHIIYYMSSIIYLYVEYIHL